MKSSNSLRSLSIEDKKKFINEVTNQIKTCDTQQLEKLLTRPLSTLSSQEQYSTEYSGLYRIMEESLRNTSTEKQKQLGLICSILILCKQLPENFVQNIIIPIIVQNQKYLDFYKFHVFTNPQWKVIGQVVTLLSVNSLRLLNTYLENFSNDDMIGLGILLAESSIDYVGFERNALEKFNVIQLQSIISALLKSKVNKIHLGGTQLQKLSLEQKTVIGQLKNKFIHIYGLSAINSYDETTFDFLRQISSLLESLDIYYANLSNCTKEQLTQLVDICLQAPLKKIKIQDDLEQWTQEKWMIFSDLLNNPMLEEIDFRGCDALYKCNSEQWRWFGNALKKGKFNKLNLNGAELDNIYDDNEKWQGFLYMISCSPATILDIGNNRLLQKITAEQCKQLGSVLSKVNQLTVSGYYGFAGQYDIADLVWKAFCSMMKENKQIIEIDLSCNALHKLNKSQWQDFSDWIKNSSIKRLKLLTNGLFNLFSSKIYTDVIALALSQPSSLPLDKQKELNYALIPENIKLLFGALASLESVDLSLNELEKWELLSWRSLLEHVSQDNAKICSINFGDLGESLSNEHIQTINKILRTCRIRQIVTNPNHGGLKYLAANSVFHHQLLNKDGNINKIDRNAIELVCTESQYSF